MVLPSPSVIDIQSAYHGANMNAPTTHRIASFGFEVVLTLGMMLGVNALAVSDAPVGLLAQMASTNPV